MQTKLKIEAVIALLKGLEFTENEKKQLVAVILKEEKTPSVSDNNVSVSESAANEGAPKKRGRPRKQPQSLPEYNKVTYNKDGSPRKPYVRRKLTEAKETVTATETEMKTVITAVPVISQTEDAAPDLQVEDKKLDFDFLYENPNNAKALIRSSEFRSDAKIWGVVIPYKKKPSTFFAVSFYEEKKKLTFTEALRKARSFPKYHGYTWDVMGEVERESILTVGEKLREQLKKYRGDAFFGCYLLSPPVSGQPYSKIRYTIEIDS